MFQAGDLLYFFVFAIGAMASLFAFFWGRRLKNGDLQVRDGWEYELATILGGGCATGGEMDVEAPSPEALVDILQTHLAHPFHAAQSPWVRSRRRLGRVSVVRAGAQGLSLAGTDLLIGEGFVQVAPGAQRGHVRVRYALSVPSARTMVTIGQLWALGLGLTASILVPALVFLYLAGSANPMARQQSLQVIQTAQVVWEPYLFIGVARARIRMSGRYLETVIASAAYEAQTGRPGAGWPQV